MSVLAIFLKALGYLWLALVFVLLGLHFVFFITLLLMFTIVPYLYLLDIANHITARKLEASEKLQTPELPPPDGPELRITSSRTRNLSVVPPKPNTQTRKAPKTYNVEKIVRAYSTVLETSAPAPGMVADASTLPYPKGIIRKALVTALRSVEDLQAREHLKFAYVMLADWQDGVGSVPRGLDLTTIDLNNDIESIARAVVDQTDGSKKWVDMANRERNILMSDLKKMGL